MSGRELLRAAWLLPFFGLSTAIFGLLSLIASLWSARRARWFAPLWAGINMRAAGIHIAVEGVQHLPANQPGSGGGCVVASNHRSAADIGAILAGLPVDVCWVTKASLLKVPFLGWHLKRVHIPIHRQRAGNTDRFLQDGADKIRAGAAVVIFPEGTRNRGPAGSLLPFKKGAFLLAHTAGQPILPVALIGSAELWPPRSLMPASGSIDMRVGQPIDPKKYGPDELAALAEETSQAIAALLAE